MVFLSLMLTLFTFSQLFSASNFFPKEEKVFRLINKNDTEHLISFLTKDKKDINTYRDKENGNSLLHRAVCRNSLAMVKILINNNINPNLTNNNSETPLYIAVCRGNIEIVQYLLEHKADPNIRNFYDDTPLHAAVLSDQQEATKVLIILDLLKYNTNIHHKNIYGNTPLEEAKKTKGCTYIIHLLPNYKQQ